MKKICFLVLLTILCLQLPASSQTSISAGDMEIVSKLMTFYNNIYVARGGLTATQQDSVLKAERGIYDRDLEIVKAFDNVSVTQPGSVLTSDYLEAYVKEDRILARGNPKLVRIVERASADGLDMNRTRVVLTCDEVEAFNKENRFLAKGNVHVIEVPYREGETEEEAKENEEKPISDLRCETLEIFSDEDKAIARTNVNIVTETLTANGDRAIYLNLENRIIIVGHAHAIQTSRDEANAEQVSELYANKIIYYPEEERTIAVGDVHATVYPGSDSGPRKGKATREEERERILEQKERQERLKQRSDTPQTSEDGPDATPPADLPPGDYTQIPTGEEFVEALADD